MKETKRPQGLKSNCRSWWISNIRLLVVLISFSAVPPVGLTTHRRLFTVSGAVRHGHFYWFTLMRLDFTPGIDIVASPVMGRLRRCRPAGIEGAEGLCRYLSIG